MSPDLKTNEQKGVPMTAHAASQTRLIGREVRLFSRPLGEPSLYNFELVRAEVPEPGDGQVLVRNTWMSVDPYMQGRMDDVPSYIPPFRLGSPLEGAAVGDVLASRSDAYPDRGVRDEEGTRFAPPAPPFGRCRGSCPTATSWAAFG
jgi:hypothetical protein